MPAPLSPTGLTPNTQARIPVNGPQAQVTLSWQPVAGATSYAVRVNDNTALSLRHPQNNCPGDPHFLCVNYLSTTSISFQARAGHNYNWWVHAINDAGWSAPTGAGFRIGEPPLNPSYMPGPLRVYMTTPSYHDVPRPTPSVWNASLYVNRDVTGEAVNLTIKADLHDTHDAIVATGQATLQGGNPSGVRNGVLGMTTPNLTSGAYRWQFRLLNPAGRQFDLKEVELRVVDTQPKVYIKDGAKLFKMGAPFFPLGMYDAVVAGEDNLSKLASFGFNTVINYTFGHYAYSQGNEAQAIQLARNYLDAAQRHGISVIYNLADLYPGAQHFPQVDKTALEVATEYIVAFREHPALLAWYLADEPQQPNRIPHLLALYQLVRDLDPQHPTLIVQLNPDLTLLDRLYNATDIFAADPYPVPDYPLTTVSDWTAITQTSARNAKPGWTVTQAHALENYYPAYPPGKREPTLAEKRCMAFLALTAQARGLILYSYFDQFSELIYDPTTGTPVVVSPPANPTILPRRLAELSAIGTEIRSLGPTLTDGQERTLGTQNAGKVRARAVEYGGYLWVLLANPSDSNSTVPLNLPAGNWGRVEAPQGTVSGRLLSSNKLEVTVPARNGGYVRLAHA
jgi:hypothetical protein